MSLSTLQQRLLPLIESSLQNYLDTLDFNKRNDLKDIIIYHMGWRADKADDSGCGKRLRPLLLLLSTGALRGDIQKSLPAAVSIEFLHNFTLIHDDIEDQSPLRHRQPTVWKKWGLAQAVNAGDALFSIAQMSMLDLRETCDEKIAAESTYHLNHTCLQLTQGQYMDLSFEHDENILVDDYLEMIKRKTAALISLTTKLSGLISGHSRSIQQELAEFGESLGMAFQIQDDGLGIWGDPKITGKSVASDIQSRKKTLPILYGLEQSKAFRQLWEKAELHTAEEVTEMAQVLEVCGVKKVVQKQTTAYTEKALSSFDKIFPKKNDAAKAIIELTHILLNRNF
jgi:geranylgeranyl diphosphate synthase, type I